MNNRDKILRTALKLFNKQGTHSVTTNHIAQACHVSPGNLYYHFKSKQEIIFCLFEEMIDSWDSETPDLSSVEPHALLELMLSKTFDYTWEYRFVHRELASLTDKDPLLKKMCIQVLQGRIKEIEAMTLYFENAKILRPLDNDERNFIAQTSLYYGLFWQPFLEVTGRPPNSKNVRQGVDMILQLIKPYMLRDL